MFDLVNWIISLLGVTYFVVESEWQKLWAS